MRIYFAGVANRRTKEVSRALCARNYLISYASGKRPFELNEDVLQDPAAHFLVDSGAFSVWTIGKSIDIDRYLEFALGLKARSRCELNFVNLDVIPGRYKQRPTHKEREEAAHKSFENFMYLKDRGLVTVNVFHQHEPIALLDRIVDEADYVGISPANDVSVEERNRWLRMVFEHLLSRSRARGEPLVRTHGFGVTATGLLMSFPFFSVDSTTWMNGAKFANFIAMLRYPCRALRGFDVVQIQRGSIWPRRAHDTAPKIARFFDDLNFRYQLGMDVFMGFEKIVTEAWVARGVEFWDGEVSERW